MAIDKLLGKNRLDLLRDEWPSLPSDAEILAAVENPCWEDRQKVHDWRNHVPDAMRRWWNELHLDAKIVAYIMAEEIATNEDWD